MKRLIYILTVTSFFFLDVKAQDPQMSQFYATPVYTNPAMAGTGQCFGGGRVALGYRNQWPALPGSIQTMVGSWDQHFDALNGGAGLMVMRDVAGQGLLETIEVSGVYSYLLEVNKKFAIRFGIQASFMQRGVDISKLTFGDQIDPVRGFEFPTAEPLANDRITTPNFGAGMLMFTDKFYFGLASHNIIEPRQSFYGDPESVLPRRYTVHTGVTIPADGRRRPKSTISPNLLFMLQNQFTQINAGFYYSYEALVAGLWYRQTLGEFRNSDALMVLFGFRKDKFRFGYSYDLTVSSLRASAAGSHEVTVSIDWCSKKRPKKYRTLTCPDF